MLNSIVSGTLALAWLILRSGTRPSRFAYPCQQAAFATAAAAFGVPVVAAILSLRHRTIDSLRTPRGAAIAGLGIVVTFGMWTYVTRAPAYTGPTTRAPASYMAEVFDQQNCPQDPHGERFVCLDDLLETMGARGLKFHRSATPSLTAGPDGILGADDVIVVKINYQWDERGGTNTDLLRGLIRRIVDHPDEFTGEIVVCENTQFASAYNFDRPDNNAQNIGQSPRDVVTDFLNQGHDVSLYDWTSVRHTQVDEYSAADLTDGYVAYPYDPDLHGFLSYPKFRTELGTYISLRDGVWDPATGYDRERLKFINLPVLKSHSATYGATSMVKNYMGVITTGLGTSSHSAMHYGLLGALLGEIRPADLNILDAIWVNANPFTGPATSYSGATRTDRLVATLDPVAGDIWAVKNILVPAFESNGYSPPWPSPSADPDTPFSDFRQYLDHSMNYIVAAGYQATNKLAQIGIVDVGPPGEASEPGGGRDPLFIEKDESGYALSWSDPVRGGPIGEYNLYAVPLGAGPAAPQCVAALGNGTTAILAALPDDSGFMVVGRNSAGDGSLGWTSRRAERAGPLPVDVCP
ncbi:MAG: DUF362 domain-containing protein [bacterium]|nr:DUF362 domain-containing protein [bacterium]